MKQLKVNLNLEMKYKIWNNLIKINDINNWMDLQWQLLYQLRQKQHGIEQLKEIKWN